MIAIGRAFSCRLAAASAAAAGSDGSASWHHFVRESARAIFMATTVINNTNKLNSQAVGNSGSVCSFSTRPRPARPEILPPFICYISPRVLTKHSRLAIHSVRFITSTTTPTTTHTMAKIISGKEVSDEIRAKLKAKVEALPIKPKLAIVQVGGREDSNVYIRMKVLFAESIGASAELIKLSRDISESDLIDKVKALNSDQAVHGIITQLPFDCSQKIDSDKIVNLIDPSKDVDGLCVYNAGKLLHGELVGESFIPCTPNGCMELIKKSGIAIEGTRSIVIGRSKIVGAPMAQLLVWANSTVTICHSRTKNLEEICRQADIVVAAVGRAQMVKKSWLKPGAVVIDCGINVIPDATKKSGTRLVGDVDYEDCSEVAGAITPVPGGVGPMTVAMLIANTVEAASRKAQK